MNRTSLVLALVVPALLGACGAGENTVGTDWPDAGNPPDTNPPPDTSFPSDPCSHCTPKSPTLLMFAADTCFSAAAGRQSQSKMFVVENRGLIASGTLTATLSGPAASNFVMTSDTCSGNLLAPGSGCAVYVAYAPDAARLAPESATLTVTDGASSASSPLQGGDVVLAASPAALDFGTVAAGSSSNELLIQVTTSSMCGAGMVVTLNGPHFIISSNTCLDVNAGRCQIGVRFAPPAGSPPMSTAGSLTVTGDSSSVTVALSGAIKLANPQTKHLTALPSTHDFGEVMVGQSANTTFTACSPFTAETPTVTVSGPGGAQFTVENANRVISGPDATCTVFQSNFAPTAAGPSQATVTVTDGTETVTVSLVGKGVAASVGLTASPALLAFGDTKIGESSAGIIEVAGAKTTLTAAITGSPSFVVADNTCKVPDQVCALKIQFAPSEAGAHSATLTISDGQSTVTVALQGIGLAAPVAPFAASPVALDFGQIQISFTSTPLVVTVGTSSARNFKLTLSDSAVSEMTIIQDTCTGSLLNPAGGTCAIGLIYKPTKVGKFEGTLDISDGTDVVSIHLTGSGWTLL